MRNTTTIYNNIGKIVSNYLSGLDAKTSKAYYNALPILLGANINKYNFEKTTNTLELDQLQAQLYRINERTDIQKNNGVYYTPEDVCRYIIWNSIISIIDTGNKRTYQENDALNYITTFDFETIENLLSKKTFFDPTCGSGEFLINVYKIKLDIAKRISNNYSESDIYYICKSIFGNDINADSTDICKLRLFFTICQELNSARYINLVAKALNNQFTNIDYVIFDGTNNNKFDCIVGNPPYVEYGKFEQKNKLQNSYGNIYADVIKNSIVSLKKGGTIGFIIPLSYISTSRMAVIRNYIIENTNAQFILNFADRPDCLFQGVHQKLNILIARKGKQEHKLYTSNYKHWYKEERKKLLNGCEIKENHHLNSSFIPKIGNQIEEDIYRKISTSTNENLFDKQVKNGASLYLNMRACFWIKSFSFNPGSNEYKEFKFNNNEIGYINCILNSSMFWLYWTIVSDCWHITSKELKGFYIPKITDKQSHDLIRLSKQLEEKLEQTKKYIGTKQSDYEYKHRDCKKEIDNIDNYLSQIFDLNSNELEYIKNFALKYRTGSGTDDKND